MFEINEQEQALQNTEDPKSSHKQTQAMTSRNRRLTFLLDAFVLLAIGGLLFWGVSTQFWNRYNDATRYQCYAVAFWQGEAGLHALGLDANPKSQCAFLANSSSTTLVQKMQERHFPTFLIKLVAAQSTSGPLHILPPEYPALTLVAFSLPLLAPAQWYQIVFAFSMLIIAASHIPSLETIPLHWRCNRFCNLHSAWKLGNCIGKIRPCTGRLDFRRCSPGCTK